MWNQKSLGSPPLVALKTNLPAKQIAELRDCFQEANRCISLEDLGPAAARISRLISRISNSFRSSLGMKSLRKMNITLLRVKEVKIAGYLDNFLTCFPAYLTSVQEISLPSRQYLQFLLIRMISLVKMLCRLERLAKEITEFFLKLLNLGHFLELSTIILATVAEVWKNSRDLCRNTVSIYNRLFSMQKSFVRTDLNFLKGFTLPPRLEVFLGASWKEMIKEKKTLIPSSTKSSLLEFSTDEDEEEKVIPIAKMDQITPMDVEVQEIGEFIDRNSFLVHSPNSVVDLNTLTLFLQKENQLRKTRDPKSLSLSISEKHWQKFLESLKKTQHSYKSKTDLSTLFPAKWEKLLKK
ncbi:hypothetical protein DMENIID0001_079930 [Sergentomyia squamirostris]